MATALTLKFAPDFSDIQTNAPFDIAGRVNQIFGYTQGRIDTTKELSPDLPPKELRYLALCKLLAVAVKPELEKLVDADDGGLDIADLRAYTRRNDLPEILDYFCKKFSSKATTDFEQAIFTHTTSVLGNKFSELIPIIEKNMGGAIENVFKIIFGLINLIPKVYNSKFNKSIGVEDFKKAVDGIYKLVSGMSDMHISVFAAFLPSNFGSKPGNTRSFHEFKDELFDFYNLANRKGKLMMLPSGKFFETLTKPAFQTNVQYMHKSLVVPQATSGQGEEINYGCPAGYVQTKHGNMIRAFYLWSKKLIEKVIYPELPRLLAG